MPSAMHSAAAMPEIGIAQYSRKIGLVPSRKPATRPQLRPPSRAPMRVTTNTSASESSICSAQIAHRFERGSVMPSQSESRNTGASSSEKPKGRIAPESTMRWPLTRARARSMYSTASAIG